MTLHQLSQAGVFIYSSHGEWSSPPPVEFFSHRRFYKLSPLLIAGCVLPLLPSPAGLWGISPLPLFRAQGAPPSLLCVFFVVIAYYSVSFFWPGRGSFCPGGYADLAQDCLWEYHIPPSSPYGPHLPKLSGGSLGALLVSHLTWSGDAMRRLEVWRIQSFASSGWFFL
jgi:hypothetical protein